MPNTPDVIVLGAGPAGAATATLMARRGARVVLLDRATFPREKPCGGLLSERGARAVAGVFGAQTLERITRFRCSNVTTSFRGEPVAEAQNAGEMRFIRRIESDAEFVACAREAGCTVREGCEIVAVAPWRAGRLGARPGLEGMAYHPVRPDPSQSRPAGAYSEVTLRSGERLRARILVGAGGVYSVIRRRVWGRRSSNHRGLGFGLIAEVPPDLIRPDRRDAAMRAPHIAFGAVPWGYGWVFPGGDRVVLGLGGLWRRKTDFRAAAARFVEAVCVPGALDRIAFRGHPIPFGNFEALPGQEDVLLVGDAAGLADPVTGEGIAFALESAQLAAAAAGDALSAGRPFEAGNRYNESYRKALLPHFQGARRARRLLFPPLIMPLAMRALRRRPERLKWFFGIASGEISYGSYFYRLAGSLLDLGV